MKIFTNRYSGKCFICSVPVAENQGFAFAENGARYQTVCLSSVCLSESPAEVQAKATGDEVREINAQGEIKMPYDPAAISILRGMPGAQWNKEKSCWKVSLSPSDRPRVLDACDRLKLSTPEGFRSVELPADTKAAIARGKAGGAYDYQLEGIEFLSGKDNCLLADDMGLGKTLQSLMAIDEGGRAIVVCPATLKLNWAHEVKKWRSDLTPIICKGRKGFVLPEAGQVVIINYDILPMEFTPTDKYGNECGAPQEWRDVLSETVLIADEAHLCKSHKAIRSKRTKVLSSLCKKSWAMTGTPLLSKGFDLWGVISTFGMGKEVFGGFHGFTRSMNAFKNKWGGWEFGTPDPSVSEKLRRRMLRRMKSEVLTSLPPKTYQDVLVGMKKKLKMDSDKAHQAMIELDADDLPGFEEYSTLRKNIAESKIPALLEMVEGFEEAGEPVVVFSAHRAPVEALSSRDGWAVIMGDTTQANRQRAVEDFQAGNLKGIACTIKAGGVGITLTRASKMIFCDLEWNPALNMQAEDRICRIGQEAQSLQYIRLVSDCAMDKHVLKLLDKKAAMIKAAIEDTCAALELKDASSKIIEESREERDLRVAEAVKIANRSWAEEKISERRAGWIANVSEEILSKEVTLEIREACEEALSFMLSVCDGAESNDGRGFNKPDAWNMTYVNSADLLESDDEIVRVVWEMLTKYSRQLRSLFPVLWGDVKKEESSCTEEEEVVEESTTTSEPIVEEEEVVEVTTEEVTTEEEEVTAPLLKQVFYTTKILLKTVLKEKGFKMKHLAEKAGISRVALSRIINRRSEPSYREAIRLSSIVEEMTGEPWDFKLWLGDLGDQARQEAQENQEKEAPQESEVFSCPSCGALVVTIDGLVNKHIDATGRGRWCDHGEQPILENPPTPEYEEYEEYLETQDECSPIYGGVDKHEPPIGLYCPNGCGDKDFARKVDERWEMIWECQECRALADIAGERR